MNANWRAATMDTIFYNEKSPLLKQHCWLKLGGGTLELCFEMGSPPAMIGKRDGNGHYRVVTPGTGGGTLHRFAQEEVLEGSWEMNGQRGFWRIIFGSPSALEAQVVPIRPKPPRRKNAVRAAVNLAKARRRRVVA